MTDTSFGFLASCFLMTAKGLPLDAKFTPISRRSFAP